MGNNKGVDWEEVQTGNWNVAKPYTNDKILKWLVLIDEYQTIATFGFSRLEGDIYMRDKNLQNTSRLNALRRLIHSMQSLIVNTKFALRRKPQRQDFEKYSTRLKRLEKFIPNLRIEKKRGNRITELNINEEYFDKIMSEIIEMIDSINFRLNDSDLIFTHTEDYEPRKIKEDLKDKYVNRR